MALEGFAQQGSVDWVALSRSTLSFSVEVLTRFSKAGVEMVTVAMGQALFARFNIKSDGQRRFSEAISKLRAVSSYGDILWFGFGVKHVIRTLAETEQGIACASICACLSVSYDSLYSSQVLKAMADTQRIPQMMTPSLSQWSSLLNICAGGVTDSTFPCLVQGISRYLSPSQEAQRCFLHSPTTPKALAGALLELASVSDGTLHSTTLIGGIDCSWLAAVAQWLLSLRVQIIDESGNILYQGQGISGDQYPQVTIVRHIENSSHGTAIRSRCFVVPPGFLFFHLEGPGLNDRPREHIFSRGRSQWSEILQDSFGQAVNKLLTPGNIAKFARFLCFGLDFSPQQRDISRLDPWHSNLASPIERRRAWLRFAASRLPELTQLSHMACFNVDVLDAQVTGTVVYQEMLHTCSCNACLTDSLYTYTITQEPTTICLLQAGLVILEFIYILSWVDIDEALQPSMDGLRALYINRGRSLLKGDITSLTTSKDIIRRSLWERPVSSIIFPLFTGLNISSINFPKDESARSGGGICIFLPSLVNPTTDPHTQLRVSIVPGHIHKDDTIYKNVSDFKRRPGFDGSFILPASTQIKDFGLYPQMTLVIEETVVSRTLKAYFWTHPSEPGRYAEAMSKDPKLTAFGPSKIRSQLVRRIALEPCGQRQVVIYPPIPKPQIPEQWTRPWTGVCFAAEKDLWATIHPSPDEWVITSPEISLKPKMEVLRASNSLMYAIICHAWASSDVRPTLISCLPCYFLSRAWNTLPANIPGSTVAPAVEEAGVIVHSMKENPPRRLGIAAWIQ